jgi:hypothetical protein
MTTPPTGTATTLEPHWSARPWFGLVAGVALVAPWLVLLGAPALSPIVVFGGPVLAGLVAGYLADRASVPGLIAGAGYAVPALAVAALDPCKSSEAWNESASGAILLLVFGPVIGVLGSRLGARLASEPSGGAGPIALAVVVVAAAVVVGMLVVAGRAIVVGCPAT